MNALEAFPLHGAWPQEFLGLEDRTGEKARLPFCLWSASSQSQREAKPVHTICTGKGGMRAQQRTDLPSDGAG